MIAVGLSAACSLDWTIGSDGGAEASTLDAPTDTGASPHDGGTSDVVDDAGHEAAASCSSLRADVGAARAAAILCMSMPTDCESHVTDQCGCTVFVAQSSSSATADYLAAIEALKMSGCPLGCASCPKPMPVEAECLVTEGLKTVCTP
jgi:hypothetical protein